MFRLAAVLAFLAVALGAFGAHGLKLMLQERGMTGAWEKAVLYHFVHALALLAVSLFPQLPKGAGWLFVAGIVLFSGSLYLMGLSNVRWLGAVTPLGGLCFLAGWAWLAWHGRP